MKLTIQSTGTSKYPFMRIMNGDEEFCSTRNREYAILIQQAFAEIDPNPDYKRPELHAILDEIYTITDINLRINTSNKRIHATPRFIYYKIASDFGYMLNETGLPIKRKHPAVFQGIKKFSDYYSTDHDFRILFDKISKKLNQKT